MTATSHIQDAARILDSRMRNDLSRDDHFEAANSHARIALATALRDLADTAKTDATPINQAAWPTGTTARILTRVGMRSREFIDATVDITDDSNAGIDGMTTALCRPCGWTRDSSLIYRDKVLEMARDHASDCTALPNPAA